MNKIIFGVLLLAVSIGGYLAYDAWGRQEALPDGLIQANGRVEGDRFTVASKFPGKVYELLVREGDAVKKGDLLARLDDTQVRSRVEQACQTVKAAEAKVQAATTALATLRKDVTLGIAAAEATVRHAEASMAKAQAAEKHTGRDAERFSNLAKKNSASGHEEEVAHLAWEVAQSDVKVAVAGLDQAQKQLEHARLGNEKAAAKEQELEAAKADQRRAEAALNEAESVLNDLTIHAPADGIITTRVCEVGEVVRAGAPLYALVNLDELYLKVYVAEAEIGNLRRGLPARIHTDAFPEQPVPATVKYIASRAEFTPREVQTPDERVKLVYAIKLYLDENPDHRLTPGMPADAVIRHEDGIAFVKPRW